MAQQKSTSKQRYYAKYNAAAQKAKRIAQHKHRMSKRLACETRGRTRAIRRLIKQRSV